MSWHYAEANERKGPVDDAAFAALVQAGVIKPETLVWTEGMSNWLPYREASEFTAAASRLAEPVTARSGGTQLCSQCGKLFPPDEMITYEGKQICAECKPLFFQRVREGADVHGARAYAGFWIRFAAKFVDGILVNLAGKVAQLACMALIADQEAAAWAAMGLSLILGASYVIYFTGKYGATPGKMVCKIEVIRADDSPMTYGRATGRYFAEYLSGLTLTIGYIMAAFDEQKRSLHDRICDTRVIYKRRG